MKPRKSVLARKYFRIQEQGTPTAPVAAVAATATVTEIKSLEDSTVTPGNLAILEAHRFDFS